jgi:hypothetical protein
VVGRLASLALDTETVSYKVRFLDTDVNFETEAVKSMYLPTPPEDLRLTDESEFQKNLSLVELPIRNLKEYAEFPRNAPANKMLELPVAGWLTRLVADMTADE